MGPGNLTVYRDSRLAIVTSQGDGPPLDVFGVERLGMGMGQSEINSMRGAIAATRFGLGARPGEIAEAARDPQGWLLAQIAPSGADQPEPPPGGRLLSSQESAARFSDAQAQIKLARAEMAAQPAMADTTPIAGLSDEQLKDPSIQAYRKVVLEPLRDSAKDEILAGARLAALTPASFRERWTRFWSNHFTVAAKNGQTAAFVGPFEREAIRPHVFGRFQDLLAASSTHPAMLLYLDQTRSAGPNSLAGTRRNLGLNENLAREILELHTVGAEAGYTQADVTEFARALTGFSMGSAREGDHVGAFLYRASLHEPGARTIMGRRYDGDGPEAAERVLADLAASPKTAEHLAFKLARHFVADQPPPSLVARLSASYRRSGGDLGELARTLVSVPEAWTPAEQKLKTPAELIISGHRAAGAAPQDVRKEVVIPLTALGQKPFGAPQPNGWSDEAEHWAAPDAIVKRLNWATAFSSFYAPKDAPPVETARAVLGPRLRPATETAIARAESRAEAFTLVLMSPEFQRR